MKMPIRWSEEGGGADSLERDILSSDLGMDPTASQQALVWKKLTGELGLASVATVAATASKPLVAKASSTLVFLKGVAVGVVACGAVWGGSQLLTVPTRAPAPAPPRVSAAPSIAGASTAGTALPRVVEEPPAEQPPSSASSTPSSGQRAPAPSAANPLVTNELASPSVAQFGDGEQTPTGSAQERDSQLKAEALLLRQARERLHAGQLALAQQALDESRVRFAAPTLYQEREALTIELLFRNGQRAAAAERAALFLKAFPGSPHASRIKTFTAP